MIVSVSACYIASWNHANLLNIHPSIYPLAADVGNYSYGYGHPMKPHRMRMAHNLISNYGLQRYMQVIRPKRATAESMTRFHTNEYIDFLRKVTPETVESLTGAGARCELLAQSHLIFTEP